MKAAVPDYLPDSVNEAPPGHKFSLYFPIWNPSTWEMEKNSKTEALNKVLAIPNDSSKQIDAVRERQLAMVEGYDEDRVFALNAVSISPLVTGMGLDHPLENGFAFLNPYGMPYLPASSIKGVLRAAARELATFEVGGWTSDTINTLFGSQDYDDEEFQRGALVFMDVIPQVTANSLAMDVMTPHQGHYYQGNNQGASAPHDAGSPNPIMFMVIPPRSQFTFHVLADRHLLKHVQNWKELLGQAFEHAFKWLGFGAKTALGYGAMADKDKLEAKNKRAEQEKALEGATKYEGYYLRVDPKNGSLFLERGREKGVGRTSGKAKEAIFNTLSEAQKDALNTKGSIKVNAWVNKEMVKVEPQ